MATVDSARIRAVVPILRWLPHYRPADLRLDLVAGLAVASVAIPTALGYATVAGVPVQVGLYALPAALIVYAIFASSRQVSMGPTSTVAIMSGAVVFAITGGTADVARTVALTSAVAVASGLFLVLAGTIRTGWLTDLISRPVISGFTIGLSILVITNELPHLIGVTANTSGFLTRLWSTLSQVPEANGETVVIGVLALAVVFGGPRISARFPWSLALMLVGIVGAAWLHPQNSNIEVLGAIPQGLPQPSVPAISLEDLPRVLLGGASVAIAGMGEGLAAARIFATRGNYRIDTDQELLGTGLANVASGFSGGMSVTGSLSRTATAALSGGRTQLTGVFAAVVVLLVLLWFTGLLSNVPRVILSAIVIVSVWPLLDWKGLDRYRRVRKNDYISALTALFGVILLGPLYGLIAAILISVLGITLRSSQATIDILGKIKGEKAGWGAVNEHPERETREGVLILRINAPLFWANSTRVTDRVLRLVDKNPDTRSVVLDMSATSQMDTTALDSLSTLLARLRDEGVDLYIARLHYSARKVLASSGFTDELGEEHMFHSISASVKAAQKSPGYASESPEDHEAAREG